MILGTGETGLDIAYEAVKAGATEVTLCSHSGYVLVCMVMISYHESYRFLSFPKALVCIINKTS